MTIPILENATCIFNDLSRTSHIGCDHLCADYDSGCHKQEAIDPVCFRIKSYCITLWTCTVFLCVTQNWKFIDNVYFDKTWTYLFAIYIYIYVSYYWWRLIIIIIMQIMRLVTGELVNKPNVGIYVLIINLNNPIGKHGDLRIKWANISDSTARHLRWSLDEIKWKATLIIDHSK